ncbi:MAG: hypothetical protein GY810_11105 [Aureispira sp.]|nr:hypothetical protein [Aureispira sp.]
MTDLFLLKYLEAPTDYKICPAVDTVFVDPSDEQHNCFLPILTVDLNLINDKWTGQVHFVYHEFNNKELPFQLDNNKYIYAGEYELEHGGMQNYERNEGFIQYVEVTVPNNPDSWGEAINKQIDKIEEDEDGYMDYLSASHLRGQPIWKEEGIIPVNSVGKPMHFIGQLVADVFSDDTEDFWLYLFYCPEENRVVQLCQ